MNVTNIIKNGNLAKIAVGGVFLLMGGSNFIFLYNQQSKIQEIQRNLQEKNQRGKICDYTLSFTVPKENDKCRNPVIENVKNAMFEAGAGYVGKNEKGEWLYSNCSNQTEVGGQYISLPASQPHIKTLPKGEKETVNEIKVWTDCNSCDRNKLVEVVKALKKAHPYEEVSYQIYKKINIE